MKESTESKAKRRSAVLRRVAPISKSLYRRHGELFTIKFDCGLTGAEERELEYVRAELDELHEAELGLSLDQLEEMAEALESIARDVDAAMALATEPA